MRDGHHSPIVEADLVLDHRHELDGGVGGEAVVPVLPCGPGARVPETPPLVVILCLRYWEIIVPPASNNTTITSLTNQSRHSNFGKETIFFKRKKIST